MVWRFSFTHTWNGYVPLVRVPSFLSHYSFLGSFISHTLDTNLIHYVDFADINSSNVSWKDPDPLPISSNTKNMIREV